jgi:tRNA (cytidine/uridine-2'-O-)-methyltransferase
VTTHARLRFPAISPPFRVVLVEPEIPQNTGSIARLCAATQSPLHLVGRLGFRIDEKSVRRAGVDYWHLVEVHQHATLEHFVHAHPDARLVLTSGKAERSYLDAAFLPGDALVFGKESVGLSDELVARYPENVIAIPTAGAVRSLNLANAVSIVLYEGLRSVGALASTALG